MERILILVLIVLGFFYLTSNGYIDLSKIDLSHISSNTWILIFMGIIVLLLLFGGRGGGRGGRGGGGRGRRW